MLTENRAQRCDTQVPLHPVTFHCQHKPWSPLQGFPRGVFLCAQGGLESQQG